MHNHRLDAILAPRFVAAVPAELIGYAYDFEPATLAHRSPGQINPRFAPTCPR